MRTAAGSGLINTTTLTGRVRYTYGTTNTVMTSSADVTSTVPVQAPYRTYSSAPDAPALYGQSGDDFAVSGAGTEMFSGSDNYSTIYQPSAVGTSSTIQTEVTAQQSLTGYGKAGILVRNSMTASGTGPEGVILFESPSGGIQLEWNSNGNTDIDSVTPGQRHHQRHRPGPPQAGPQR